MAHCRSCGFMYGWIQGFRVCHPSSLFLHHSALPTPACSRSQIGFSPMVAREPRIFKFLWAHGLRKAAIAFPNVPAFCLYMGETVLDALCVFSRDALQKEEPSSTLPWEVLLHEPCRYFLALWFLDLANVDSWQITEGRKESEVRVFIPSAPSLTCSHGLVVSLNWGSHLASLSTRLPLPPDSTYCSCPACLQD